MGQWSGGRVIDRNFTWEYVEYATETVVCGKSPFIQPDAECAKGRVIEGRLSFRMSGARRRMTTYRESAKLLLEIALTSHVIQSSNAGRRHDM
jgi:hypothetical protein